MSRVRFKEAVQKIGSKFYHKMKIHHAVSPNVSEMKKGPFSWEVCLRMWCTQYHSEKTNFTFCQWTHDSILWTQYFKVGINDLNLPK